MVACRDYLQRISCHCLIFNSTSVEFFFVKIIFTHAFTGHYVVNYIKGDFMKIPNILTVFRILLIPVFIFLFFSDVDNHLTYALIVFVIAGITDILDGFIARRFNMITDLGKVLDPLADKLMLITVLFCLAATEMVPLWIIGLVIIKELVMVYGGIRLYFSKTQIIIPANRYGKIATVAFYLALCMVLLNIDHMMASLVLYFAVAITLYAFYSYLMIAIRAKSEKNDR